MIEIKNFEIFNIIDFLERTIKSNIKNIHKKYLDKTQESKGKAGILFLTVYERDITSISFLRMKDVVSGINFQKNYIELKFSNIFNSKEKSDIEKFEKYIFNHLNKIKSNILKNDMIDKYLIDLSIENYMKSYQPFYSQTLFNKKDIIKYLDNFPNILQQKYDNFVDNVDNDELYDELYDELIDLLEMSSVFINKTYYEYNKNKDYYDKLINTLDIICKNKDLMHFIFYYLNDDELNFIDDILYKLIFKNKQSEVFIKQLLQTNNINLILFLIDTVLYDIDMDEPLTAGQYKKHIETIKQYLSPYKIEISKSYGCVNHISFLEIDYKIIDGYENTLILK